MSDFSDPPDLLSELTDPTPRTPIVGPQTPAEKSLHAARLKKALGLSPAQLQDLATAQLKLADDGWRVALVLPDTFAPGPILQAWYPQEQARIGDDLARAEALRQQSDPASQDKRKRLLAEAYFRAYYLAEPAQLSIAVSRAGDIPVTLGGRYDYLYSQVLEGRSYLITGRDLPTNGSPASLLRQIKDVAQELRYQQLEGPELWRLLIEVPDSVQELPGTLTGAAGVVGHTVGQMAGAAASGAAAGVVDGMTQPPPGPGPAPMALWKKAAIGVGAAGVLVLLWRLARRSSAVNP